MNNKNTDNKKDNLNNVDNRIYNTDVYNGKYEKSDSDDLTFDQANYGVSGYTRDANGDYSMELGATPNPLDPKDNKSIPSELIDKASIALDPTSPNITDKNELKKIRDELVAFDNGYTSENDINMHK